MLLFANNTPMKLKQPHTLLVSVALLCTAVLLMSTSPKVADYGWLKQRLETTKSFTLEVIKAMPADSYDFKPNDDVRSFKAQAYHIIYSINYFNRVFKGNASAPWSPGGENSKSKAELIEWATEQFDTINATILAAEPSDALTNGILSYLDHNAHHRGQMITYLRMNDITPPSYR